MGFQDNAPGKVVLVQAQSTGALLSAYKKAGHPGYDSIQHSPTESPLASTRSSKPGGFLPKNKRGSPTISRSGSGRSSPNRSLGKGGSPIGRRGTGAGALSSSPAEKAAEMRSKEIGVYSIPSLDRASMRSPTHDEVPPKREKKAPPMLLAKGGANPPRVLPAGSAIYQNATTTSSNMWSSKKWIQGVSPTNIGCSMLASQDIILKGLLPRPASRSLSTSSFSYVSDERSGIARERSRISDLWSRPATPLASLAPLYYSEGIDTSIPDVPARPFKELLVLEPRAMMPEVVVWDAEKEEFGLHKQDERNVKVLSRQGSRRGSMAGSHEGDDFFEDEEEEAQQQVQEPPVEEFEDVSFAAIMAEQLQNAANTEEKKSRIYLHFQRVVHVLTPCIGKIENIQQMRQAMIRYCKDEHLAQNALVGLEMALHNMKIQQDFFDRILPDMITRAVRIFEYFPAGDVLPLKPDETGKVVLTRPTVACLVSLMFLCALPNNQMSFASLLYSQQSYQVAKLMFYINYFNRISDFAPDEPAGLITIVKNILPYDRYDWAGSNEVLTPLRVETRQLLEDNVAAMHVDFAHAEIGGGLLFRGCGEEEIRFCIAPELSVACLVCSKMMPNEAVVVTGYERFSNYSGKGFTMDYAGNFVDPSPRYEDGSLRTCLVCIDPSRFDKFQEKLMRLQLSRQVLQRELDKVVTGLWNTPETMDFDAVATGKWGSGVMHGDPEVKVLVQWMAASECGREVDYHVPYDIKDRKFIQRLREFSSKMIEENITVGQMWDACSDLADFDVKAGTVFESMLMLVAQWKEQERAEMQDSPMPLASQPGSSKTLPVGSTKSLVKGATGGGAAADSENDGNSEPATPSSKIGAKERRIRSQLFRIHAEELGLSSPGPGSRKGGSSSGSFVNRADAGKVSLLTPSTSFKSQMDDGEIQRRGTGTAAGSGLIPARVGGASKKNLRILNMRGLEIEGKLHLEDDEAERDTSEMHAMLFRSMGPSRTRSNESRDSGENRGGSRSPAHSPLR